MYIKYISSSITGTNKNSILILTQSHLYKKLVSKEIVSNVVYFFFFSSAGTMRRKRGVFYLEQEMISGFPAFAHSAACTGECSAYCLGPTPIQLYLTNSQSLHNIPAGPALLPVSLPRPLWGGLHVPPACFLIHEPLYLFRKINLLYAHHISLKVSFHFVNSAHYIEGTQ